MHKTQQRQTVSDHEVEAKTKIALKIFSIQQHVL